jgi:hypothetical protein
MLAIHGQLATHGRNADGKVIARPGLSLPGPETG